jgi:hypothetical protein
MVHNEKASIFMYKFWMVMVLDRMFSHPSLIPLADPNQLELRVVLFCCTDDSRHIYGLVSHFSFIEDLIR